VTRIIDIHAHVFPDDVAAAAMPRLQEEADVEATYDGTLAGLLQEMDRAGIDVAVTQPVATKPSQVNGINEWASGTAGERIVPFGSLHPDTENPAAEVAKMASLGLRGVKMHPEYQAFRPDEDRMAPLYEALIEADMIVLFHAGLDIAIPTDFGRPGAFARMLERWPDLTAILAHMGGWNLWDEVRACLLGAPAYFDTSYAYGHMRDEDFLELVVGHGAERVLFGTDGPWADMSAEIRWLAELGMPPADLEAILGGNAERMLGLT
jgi:predicted TIM-barrel fold metal-dependent hydrolase